MLLPIPVYKNTAAHDRRASRRYVRVQTVDRGRRRTTRTNRRIFTGLKHQCVELARRWCVRAYNTTFKEVDNASDMMSLRRGTCVICGRAVRLGTKTISNGPSDRHGRSAWPDIRRGDLLVWKRGRRGPYMKTGHVAVVVNSDATAKKITIAEQNGTTRNGHRTFVLDAKTRRILAGRIRVLDTVDAGSRHNKHACRSSPLTPHLVVVA